MMSSPVNSTPERWLFNRDQIKSSPSSLDGISYAKEMAYRQQCSGYIQEIGMKLHVSQMVINTAIVYMHRFYMLQSFARVHRYDMAPACMFLACKVEEQNRQLECVLYNSHLCLYGKNPNYVPMHKLSPEDRQKHSDRLVRMENLLLQTLAFDLILEHSHAHIVCCTKEVTIPREVSQVAYGLATTSLHLTVFSVQLKPTLIGIVCIQVAAKLLKFDTKFESKYQCWWHCIDPTVTLHLIEDLSKYYIKVLEANPSKLNRILNSSKKPQTKISSHVTSPNGSCSSGFDDQINIPEQSKFVPHQRVVNGVSNHPRSQSSESQFAVNESRSSVLPLTKPESFPFSKKENIQDPVSTPVAKRKIADVEKDQPTAKDDSVYILPEFLSMLKSAAANGTKRLKQDIDIDYF